MPAYTMYFGNRHAGESQTCTGTPGGCLYGPPMDDRRPWWNTMPMRGVYVKQSATEYRWCYDEPASTRPTTWTAP